MRTVTCLAVTLRRRDPPVKQFGSPEGYAQLIESEIPEHLAEMIKRLEVQQTDARRVVPRSDSLPSGRQSRTSVTWRRLASVGTLLPSESFL
jgi:hypothetical protein